MKTSDEQQNENGFTTPFDDQNRLLHILLNDNSDDEHGDDEEEVDESEVEERKDWGDVDPAGGDAPSSPGSAV